MADAPETAGGSDAGLASPLPFVFQESKRGDRQAREALFCTFNADLGYFERTVLGVTQSTGARVTVVGDGWVSDPDPRAARNAGTRYVHGLAAPRQNGAFHPKVTVLAGPERALVAVGSGNLSPGGWHLNAETLTVATADREQCPAIVADVANWLRTLDTVCAISAPAADGIARTASLLEEIATAATIVDTGHRLVHTSSAPLIDQVPQEDVDHLLLYAPFHDERAAALRDLIVRLLPIRVTLAVQSDGRTVIQPDAIRRVIADLGVDLDVVRDDGERYRHGKLVEAVASDGSRWTLTGSPNLSARALLLPASGGGNVEVAVITRQAVSLFPTGMLPIPLTEVAPVSISRPAERQYLAGLTLLSAIRTPVGLSLAFARDLAAPAQVLASVETAFDTWEEIGVVPAGPGTHVLTGVDLPGGARVRCAREDGEGTLLGGIVFVTDPAQVLRRPGEPSPSAAGTSQGPITLIGDPRMLELWLSSLGEIAAGRVGKTLRRVTAPALPQGEGAAGRDRGGLRLDTAEENWVAYTDDAQASLGTVMLHFVLDGPPGLRVLADPADSGLRVPTDVLVSESRPGLDSDDETVADATGDDGAVLAQDGPDAGSVRVEEAVGRLRDLPEAEQRRVRRVLTAQVADEKLASYSAAERLAVLTLILVGAQADVWDGPLGPDGWLRVVSKVLRKLDCDDIPERLSSRAASWAALALYLIHEHRPAAGRSAEVAWYENAASSVSHLLPDADPQLIADYAEPFLNQNGYPVDPDAVMHVISMTVQGDLLADAIEALRRSRPSWVAHKHGDRLLHIAGEFRVTLLPAMEALEAIPPGAGTTAVWVTGTTTGWTIAIREADTLIRVEKDARSQGVTWWHYQLASLVGPLSIARNPEQASRARIQHGPLRQPFAAGRQALATVGIDISADPRLGCPSA